MLKSSLTKALLLGATISGVGAPAYAQTAQTTPSEQAPAASDASEPTEQIVVTARRHEENIQDVPVAITLLNANTLREQQVNTGDDLQNLVPSLSLSQQRSHENSTYSIRGLGQGLLGLESVVNYFSEVPGPAVTGAGDTGGGQAIYDLSNVQVLKGPQGTLFGRTATAGAILFTPQHPIIGDNSGYIDTRVGSYGLVAVDGALNLPISDNLAARVAIHREHQDGYTDVIGGGDAMDETNNEAYRLSLEFDAQPFKNYAVFDYFHAHETAAAGQISGIFPALLDIYKNGGPTDALLDAYQAQLIAENARLTSGGDDAVRRINPSAFPLENRADSQRFIDIAELSLDGIGLSGFTLRNIFGYQRFRNITEFDAGNLGIVASGYGSSSSTIVGFQPVFGIGPYHKFYTEEFQVNGDLLDHDLQMTLGYYYQRAPIQRDLNGVSNIFTYGPFTYGAWFNAYNYFVDGEATETAWYGQGTLNLEHIGLNGFSFTAGYRHSNDRQEQSTEAPDVSFYSTGNLTPGGVVTVEDPVESSGDNWTTALNYSPDRDLTFYATISQGYKPGGRNNFPSVPANRETFSPETVRNYELGVKTQFDDVLGFRGHVYADVYRLDYSDIQRAAHFIVCTDPNDPTTCAPSAFALLVNAAAARLEGFELEGVAENDNGWQFSLAYSHNSSKYTRWIGEDPLGFDPPPATLDLTNNDFSNAPEDKLSVTARYTFHMADNIGDISPALTLYYQSKVWFDDTPQRVLQIAPILGVSQSYLADAISQDAYTTLNLRVDWTGLLGTDVDAAFFINNLTDETYAVGGADYSYTAGFAQKNYAAPRMYGVELRYAFGGN